VLIRSVTAYAKSPFSAGAELTRTNTILSLLVAACSAVSWWPSTLEPALDVPWWIPLIVVALGSGLATILSNGRWLYFLGLSASGTFAGLLVGFALWPPEDGIAQSYAGLESLAATLAVALLSVVAGLAGRMLPVAVKKHRQAFWLVLAACAAFGPGALAVRPSIIAHRVARNDRLATSRFQSLKTAVERTAMDPALPARICDGETLKRNYSDQPSAPKAGAISQETT